MKQTRANRAAALLAALAVTLTLVSGPALAAPAGSEAAARLNETAQSANLIRKGPAETVSAPQNGAAFTAVLAAPEDVDQSAPVAVLVQAVDEDGAPLAGSPVRCCLGTLQSDGTVTLRYQQPGCGQFAMMAAQPAVDHGAVQSLSASAVSNGSNYTVTYSASMTMSEDMATVVTVNKDDTDTLKTMRFTCYLEDEVLRQIPDFSQAEISFSGADTYELVGVEKTEQGVAVTYKLKDSAVEGWRTQDVVTVKEMLRTGMTMSCQGEVSEAALTAALAGGELYTYGRVEVTRPGGQVPYFHCEKVIVPAAPAAVSISSGSSGSDPVAPVETEESEHGDVQVTSSARVGDEVTVDLTPDPGFAPRYLFVLDENGELVDLTLTEDGTYSFIMPRGGVNVMAGFRTVVADPADTGVADVLKTDQHVAFMQGDDKGTFRPDASITRAEVAQMFYRLLRDQSAAEPVRFADVPEDAWYAEAVSVLAGLGIVNGVGGDCFAPERPITRAEFAVLCVRFAGETQSELSFTDVPEDYWARDEIASAAAYGWIDGIGNGQFAPERQITRGEAAALTNRVLGRLGDIVAIQKGEGRIFPDVNGEHWAYGEIMEATTDHACSFNDERSLEYWK